MTKSYFHKAFISSSSLPFRDKRLLQMKKEFFVFLFTLKLSDRKLRPRANMIPRWFVLKSKRDDCLLLKDLWLHGMFDRNPNQLALNDKLIVVCVFDNRAICPLRHNTLIPPSFISRESVIQLFFRKFGTVAVMLHCTVADPVVKIPILAASTHWFLSMHFISLFGTNCIACFRNVNV